MKNSRTHPTGRRKTRKVTLPLAWAAAGLAVAALIGPSEARAQLPADSVRTVTVDAVCADGGLSTVTISPWTLYVPVPSAVTDDNVRVQWIQQNSSPDSIAIQAKDNGRWPFGLTRMRGRGAGAAIDRVATGKMLGRLPRRGGQGIERRVRENEVYQYNIIIYCTVDGNSYTVTIDPDIGTGGGT